MIQSFWRNATASTSKRLLVLGGILTVTSTKSHLEQCPLQRNPLMNSQVKVRIQRFFNFNNCDIKQEKFRYRVKEFLVNSGCANSFRYRTFFFQKNIVKLQGDIKTSELEWKQVFAIFFCTRHWLCRFLNKSLNENLKTVLKYFVKNIVKL